MKVLLVHNFYGSSSPSGEDAVYRDELELLENHGVEVIRYERHNDDVGSRGVLSAAVNTVWSGKSYREISDLIRKERPDIAHFHNIWYLISPSAYYACKDAGVPVVQTLHNFRMFCANGLLMREGKVCEDCIGNAPWRSVYYGCFRESRLYSLPVALAETVHAAKKTWDGSVDAYIALTEFGKRKFIECGLPREKIFVKPNFLPDTLGAGVRSGDYAVFIGRFSQEKGIDVLIEALKSLRGSSAFSFKMIGDGPLKKDLMKRAQDREVAGKVEFTGRKSFKETIELLCGAGFLIMPAVCYENFPLAIREAFACGKPVVASNLGAMAELVSDGRTGLLFKPGDAADLAGKISWMIDNEDERLKMGKEARTVFEERYTAERNFGITMDIYKKTIRTAKGLV